MLVTNIAPWYDFDGQYDNTSIYYGKAGAGISNNAWDMIIGGMEQVI